MNGTLAYTAGPAEIEFCKHLTNILDSRDLEFLMGKFIATRVEILERTLAAPVPEPERRIKPTSLRTCPKCDALYHRDLKICPSCGARKDELGDVSFDDVSNCEHYKGYRYTTEAGTKICLVCEYHKAPVGVGAPRGGSPEAPAKEDELGTKLADLVTVESVWCNDCGETRPVKYDHMKCAQKVNRNNHDATDIVCDRFHIVATLHHPSPLAKLLGIAPLASLEEDGQSDQEIVNEYAVWCAGFDKPKLPTMYAKMCWWHDKALMLNRSRLGLSGRAE